MHSGGLLAGLELRFTSTAERLLEAGGISTQQTRLDPSGNDSAIRRCLRISDQRAQPWCLQLHQYPSWLSPLHFNPHKPNVPGLQLGDFLAYDLLSASHVKTPRPSAVPQMQSKPRSVMDAKAASCLAEEPNGRSHHAFQASAKNL